MTDGLERSYRRFAAAILARAVRDARSGNGEAAAARRWLAVDPLAGYLLDGLGLDADQVSPWLDGLEALAQPALL